MFPYVEPTVETADKIDKKQEIIDTNFIDLKSKFDKVNDVISEQKKNKKKLKIQSKISLKQIILIIVGGKETCLIKKIRQQRPRLLKKY